MANLKQKKSAVTDTLPKFNIKQRFNRLNSMQKAIVIQEYTESLGVQPRTFYHTLNRETLTDEELQFFSGIFDCRIQDLYNSQPKPTPSIYELERKASGRVDPGKQACLDV